MGTASQPGSAGLAGAAGCPGGAGTALLCCTGGQTRGTVSVGGAGGGRSLGTARDLSLCPAVLAHAAIHQCQTQQRCRLSPPRPWGPEPRGDTGVTLGTVAPKRGTAGGWGVLVEGPWGHSCSPEPGTGVCGSCGCLHLCACAYTPLHVCLHTCVCTWPRARGCRRAWAARRGCQPPAACPLRVPTPGTAAAGDPVPHPSAPHGLPWLQQVSQQVTQSCCWGARGWQRRAAAVSSAEAPSLPQDHGERSLHGDPGGGFRPHPLPAVPVGLPCPRPGIPELPSVSALPSPALTPPPALFAASSTPTSSR